MYIQQIIFLALVGSFAGFIGIFAGGGGLITLPSMMLFGFPVQSCIGANKFALTCSGVTNSIVIIREKRVSRQLLLTAAVFGACGGVVGGVVTTNIDEKFMNIIVLILLIFALFITLLKIPSDGKEDRKSPVKLDWRQRFFAFLIGIYDGGFGPGSSTLGIVMFMRNGFRYIQSAHITRVMLLGSNGAAMIVYLQSGYMRWQMIVPLTIGVIVGSQAALLLLPKISLRKAKILLTTVTVLLILQVLLKVIPH